MVCLLGVLAGEEEALDLGSGVERVLLLGVEFVGVLLEHRAQVAGVERAVLVDDDAEDQDFAVAEDVGGNPVKRAPVNAEAQVALLLRGKTANRGPVKGEILVGVEKEFLVVIEQVQAAFKIREQDRHRLDALFVGEVFQTRFFDLVDGNPADAFMLGLQILFFKLLIGEGKEIAVISRHGSPSGEMKIRMNTVWAEQDARAWL